MVISELYSMVGWLLSNRFMWTARQR